MIWSHSESLVVFLQRRFQQHSDDTPLSLSFGVLCRSHRAFTLRATQSQTSHVEGHAGNFLDRPVDLRAAGKSRKTPEKTLRSSAVSSDHKSGFLHLPS